MRKLVFVIITLLAVFNLISAFSGHRMENNTQNAVENVEEVRAE